MIRTGCGLRGSWQYCEAHRGLCCGVCAERGSCERACRNAPERCGQTCPLDTAGYAPTRKTIKSETRKEPNAKKRT